MFSECDRHQSDSDNGVLLITGEIDFMTMEIKENVEEFAMPPSEKELTFKCRCRLNKEIPGRVGFRTS